MLKGSWSPELFDPCSFLLTLLSSHPLRHGLIHHRHFDTWSFSNYFHPLCTFFLESLLLLLGQG